MAESTETQLRKYSGKNCRNNRITVDFQNQKVSFRPIGNVTRRQAAISLATSIGLIYIMMTVVILFPINLIIAEITTEQTQIMLSYIYAISAIATGITGATIIYIKSRNKKWMIRKYPKLNALVCNLTIGGKRKIKIRPNDLTENMAVIPYFQNIELQYKATGDFTNINKIYVNSLGDQWKWYCIFKFKKNIKTGTLTIKYH